MAFSEQVKERARSLFDNGLSLGEVASQLDEELPKGDRRPTRTVLGNWCSRGNWVAERAAHQRRLAKAESQAAVHHTSGGDPRRTLLLDLLADFRSMAADLRRDLKDVSVKGRVHIVRQLRLLLRDIVTVEGQLRSADGGNSHGPGESDHAAAARQAWEQRKAMLAAQANKQDRTADRAQGKVKGKPQKVSTRSQPSAEATEEQGDQHEGQTLPVGRKRDRKRRQKKHRLAPAEVARLIGSGHGWDCRSRQWRQPDEGEQVNDQLRLVRRPQPKASATADRRPPFKEAADMTDDERAAVRRLTGG